MRKHDVALNKSGITFAGITTTLAVVDAFVLGKIPSIYELEHVQWEDRCVKSYEDATPQLLSMCECMLHV